MAANPVFNVSVQRAPDAWSINQGSLVHQGNYNDQDLSLTHNDRGNGVLQPLPSPPQQRMDPRQLDRAVYREERIRSYNPPPPRQGHTFGDIIAEGESKIIRGNVTDEGNIEALAWARDHKFGTLTMRDRAQVINGDTDTRSAGAFLGFEA